MLKCYASQSQLTYCSINSILHFLFKQLLHKGYLVTYFQLLMNCIKLFDLDKLTFVLLTYREGIDKNHATTPHP